MKTDIIQTWFGKVAEYIMYAFFVSFPFLLFHNFLYAGTSFRSVSLMFVSIVLVIFAFFSVYKKNTITVPKSLIFLSLFLYFVSMVVSAALGLSFRTSFWSLVTRTSGLWYFLHLGLFLWILWMVLRDKIVHTKLIFLIIISAATFSLFSVVGPEGWGWFFTEYKNDGFTFGNSSFAAMYLFGAFVLSIYYILQADVRKWWMYVLPFIILINPYNLNKNVWFGDFSQGVVGEARLSSYVTILSLFGFIVFWCIQRFLKERKRVIVAYGMFAVWLVGLVWCTFSLLSPNGFLREVYLSQATAARPLVWAMTERAIAERPVWGWGIDNFERVFEANYDNRLLEGIYGSETWFDRSHNIFLDQVVDNGIFGLVLYFVVYIVLLVSLLYVFINTRDTKDRWLAATLFIYFALHIAELQTVFDTTISYIMLGFMFVSSVVLYQRTRKEISGVSGQISISAPLSYVVMGTGVLFCLWSLWYGFIPFARAQYINGYVRDVGFAEKRIPVYPILFGSPVDSHAFLWRTAVDFQRGIGQDPKVLADPKKVDFLKQEIALFEQYYRTFVSENPNHFRARLNLADLLIYQALFKVDKLDEAQKVLDEAIMIVPTSPQPYWMKAVAYLYMQKFDLAKEYARKGLELNPGVEESQQIVKYIDESVKTFPEIEVYFFRKI